MFECRKWAPYVRATGSPQYSAPLTNMASVVLTALASVAIRCTSGRNWAKCHPGDSRQRWKAGSSFHTFTLFSSHLKGMSGQNYSWQCHGAEMYLIARLMKGFLLHTNNTGCFLPCLGKVWICPIISQLTINEWQHFLYVAPQCFLKPSTAISIHSIWGFQTRCKFKCPQ